MKTIANNKKARFDYEILEEIEAGIELKGPEVKSLRNGKCNLKGSFCKYFNSELFMFDVHISRFEQTDGFSKIDETRSRKLLMSRKELNKWMGRLEKEQHLTIVPLSMYFNQHNKVKVKVGLCKGKKLYDKRADQKEKDVKRKLQQRDY